MIDKLKKKGVESRTDPNILILDLKQEKYSLNDLDGIAECARNNLDYD